MVRRLDQVALKMDFSGGSFPGVWFYSVGAIFAIISVLSPTVCEITAKTDFKELPISSYFLPIRELTLFLPLFPECEY